MPTKKDRKQIAYNNILFGKSTLICLVLLLAGTTIVSADRHSVELLVLTIIFFDTASLIVASSNVVWLGYLVFGTKGAGHYKLTVWSLADTLIGHLLFHTSISNLLWKSGAAGGVYTVFSHTGDVSAWYALYDLTIYAFQLFGGGGIVENVPLAEMARLMSALEMLWNAIVLLLMIASAVATLQMHTDAPATESKRV